MDEPRMRGGSDRDGGGAESDPPPRRGNVGAVALWFGLFGAPLVWSIQLMVSYALIAHGCYPKAVPRAALPSGGAWTAALVVSVLALLSAIAAGATALHSWRDTKSEAGGRHATLTETGEGRRRFMAFSGILVSALFLFGIIFNAVPLLAVPPCTYGS